MAVQQLQHTHGTTVVPSDTLYLFQSLGYPYRVSSALFVGVGGSVRVLTEGGDDVVFSSVPDGTFMPVHVVKVFATGTTASSIVAVDLSDLNPFDADALAFFARVTTAGGSLSATEQTAVNTLVVQMKADGIWSKMKAIYPMVGASAAACAQNLVSSSFTGSFTSGWTFASTGVKGNGTSAYFDTALNWNTNTSLNDVSVGSYLRTVDLLTNAGYYGVVQGGAYTLIATRTSCDFYVNEAGSGTIATLVPGLHSATRKNSTQQSIYINGTLNITGTRNSTSKPNANFWYGAANGFPTYNNEEIALGFISDGLDATQNANFYTAVQTFQTTLSRQV